MEPAALARFLPAWHGVGSNGRGLDRLHEVVAQLQGVPIPASVLERDVLPARVRDYSPRLLDELCAAGDVMWVGAGPLGRDDGRVVLLLRDRAPLVLPDLQPAGERPDGAEHERLREVLATRGACFFRELGGADDTPDGALMARKQPQQPITNYVSVNSVTEFSKKIEKLGGKICMAKTAVPQMGYFAVCHDTEANTFGIWQSDPDAK